MEIHDPVFVRNPDSIGFGVIVRIVVTTDAAGERTSYSVQMPTPTLIIEYPESHLCKVDGPSMYDYGVRKFIADHPAYKWAIEESERLRNPVPEPTQAPESVS